MLLLLISLLSPLNSLMTKSHSNAITSPNLLVTNEFPPPFQKIPSLSSIFPIVFNLRVYADTGNVTDEEICGIFNDENETGDSF